MARPWSRRERIGWLKRKGTEEKRIGRESKDVEGGRRKGGEREGGEEDEGAD